MTPQNDFVAFVGIDWADEEHAVCLLASHGGEMEPHVLPQKAEAIEDWVAQLRSRFEGQRVAVCLEQSRGALMYALMKYDGLVLYPINPKQLARYREAMHPSGGKDDPADAELLCRFVREHHHHLRAWEPDDATTRGLRLLSEQRRQWVAQRTRLGNQLLRMLKECYPLALEWSSNLYANPFLALLAKFPSQRELQRASPKQLARYLPKKRRVPDDPPAEAMLADRIKNIRAAQPLTNDQAVLESGRLAVRHLVTLLQHLNQTVDEYDQKIAELLAIHPDAALFSSFPGAGEALTPRLVAAFGTDRKRYESAQDLQQLSGTAPITVRSGKSCRVYMRRACPKFLRQTFHEFARCSIAQCDWARAYCAQMQAKGHGYQSAVRALAFKWIRILFRCWKTNQPYDDAKYLQQLRQKNSPILAYLTPESTT